MARARSNRSGFEQRLLATIASHRRRSGPPTDDRLFAAASTHLHLRLPLESGRQSHSKRTFARPCGPWPAAGFGAGCGGLPASLLMNLVFRSRWSRSNRGWRVARLASDSKRPPAGSAIWRWLEAADGMGFEHRLAWAPGERPGRNCDSCIWSAARDSMAGRNAVSWSSARFPGGRIRASDSVDVTILRPLLAEIQIHHRSLCDGTVWH